MELTKRCRELCGSEIEQRNVLTACERTDESWYRVWLIRHTFFRWANIAWRNQNPVRESYDIFIYGRGNRPEYLTTAFSLVSAEAITARPGATSTAHSTGFRPTMVLDMIW